MQHTIPMRFDSGRDPLLVEIPDDTPAEQRMRVAVETAVRQEKSLQGADLQGANLRGADLRDANLRDAYLDGVIFSPPDDPSWSAIRDDLSRFLDQARFEVPALLAALREGRVDGSVYDGDCACLFGTIASVREVNVDPYGLPFRNASSPIERLFLAISRGDTPETNPIAKIVEEWIVKYQQEHGL